ncbi:MAG TPA: DUF3106 domain-containing protein [Terriglobales bacterium]|nr:DUF3106 domain-containing protein [Terriglobales bacterium]
MKTSHSLILIFALCLPLVAGRAAGADDNWRNLSPREKDRVQRNYQRWQNLPPRDKEHLREEWNRWQNLPQDQRERLKQRFDDQRRDRRRD